MFEFEGPSKFLFLSVWPSIRVPVFCPLGIIHVECLILEILELSVSLSVVLYGVPVFYPLEIIHVECLFFLESVNSSFL